MNFPTAHPRALLAAVALLAAAIASVSLAAAQSGGEVDPAGAIPPDKTHLIVTKTAALTNVGMIQYTVTVRNLGPHGATDITVTDTLGANQDFDSISPDDDCDDPVGQSVECTIDSLAAGVNRVFTIVADPTEPTGTFENSVEIASDSDFLETDNEASAQITIGPDLRVQKTVQAGEGDELEWTITVTNVGDINATGVTLTDTFSDNHTFDSIDPDDGCTPTDHEVECDIGDLGAGEDEVFTLITTRDNGDPGTFSNTATVDGTEDDPNPGNDTDSAEIVIGPDLSVEKEVTDVDEETITYTITVRNESSDFGATSVVVEDTFSFNQTFDSINPSAGCTPDTNSVTCTGITVAEDDEVVLTLVTTRETDLGTFTNSVSVSGAEDDPNENNNSDTVALTIGPDLEVEKSVVQQGGQLNYTVTVTNLSTTTAATGVTLEDNPSGSQGTNPGDQIVNDQTILPAGQCSRAASPSNTITCSFGTIAAGASRTLTFSASPQGAGTFTNSATVSASQTDPNPDNNTDSVQTNVTASANLSVDKVAEVQEDGTILYTITVANAGPNNATGVTIEDTFSDNQTVEAADIDPEDPSVDCNLVVVSNEITCDIGDLASGEDTVIEILASPDEEFGTFENEVTVSGNEADPSSGNNTDSVETVIGPTADLSVEKTVEEGEATLLVYTITVTNNGPETATNVTVEDVLGGDAQTIVALLLPEECEVIDIDTIQCDAGDLEAEETAEFVITTDRVQPDGTFSNVATVTADEDDADEENNEATAEITVEPAADLLVEKTGELGDGQTVTYTVTVTNLGPADATGVVLEDLLSGNQELVSVDSDPEVDCELGLTEFTCDIGDLDAQDLITFTVVADVIVDSGTLTNTATVTADQDDSDEENNEATAELEVDFDQADLILEKHGDIESEAPQIVYTIIVTNLGPATATGVTVTDTLSTNQEVVSTESSQGEDCAVVDNVVTCDLGDLEDDGIATITIVTDRLTPDGTFTNEAEVAANEDDPIDTNNSQSVSFTIEPPPGTELFEGWNPVEDWPTLLNGVSNITAYLSQAISPDVWLAMAYFDGEQWRQLFRNPPLPSFNTLTQLQPGWDVWLYLQANAILDYP